MATREEIQLNGVKHWKAENMMGLNSPQITGLNAYGIGVLGDGSDFMYMRVISGINYRNGDPAQGLNSGFMLCYNESQNGTLVAVPVYFDGTTDNLSSGTWYFDIVTTTITGAYNSGVQDTAYEHTLTLSQTPPATNPTFKITAAQAQQDQYRAINYDFKSRIVTTNGTQTITGVKTFDSNIKVGTGSFDRTITGTTNYRRVLIGGGATTSTSSSGAYITLQGNDYGGTGQGGDIILNVKSDSGAYVVNDKIQTTENGLLAARPTNPVDGQQYYATDYEVLFIYRDPGINPGWNAEGLTSINTSTTLPNPGLGIYNLYAYDTNTGARFIWLGGIGWIPATQAGTVKKRIEIGPWDMDLTGSVFSNNHGLSSSELLTVSSISVTIINDAQTSVASFDTDSSSGTTDGLTEFRTTQVFLRRPAGGYFDSTDFDDAVMNRGFITFEYIPD